MPINQEQTVSGNAVAARLICVAVDDKTSANTRLHRSKLPKPGAIGDPRHRGSV